MDGPSMINWLQMLRGVLERAKITDHAKHNIKIALATSKAITRIMYNRVMNANWSNVRKQRILTSRCSEAGILDFAQFHGITDARRLEGRHTGYGAMIADGVNKMAPEPITAEYIEDVKYILQSILECNSEIDFKVVAGSVGMFSTRGISFLPACFEVLQELQAKYPDKKFLNQIQIAYHHCVMFNTIYRDNLPVDEPDDGSMYPEFFQQINIAQQKHLNSYCGDEKNCPFFHPSEQVDTEESSEEQELSDEVMNMVIDMV